jgi:dTDP-4-dehydrorhamnose 3,5-epimerase-like enzyme
MITKLNIFSDSRGDLIPFEFDKLPFIPKRIFTVNNVPKNSIRGEHSHFETVQILLCISGEIEVITHDGISEKKITIKKGELTLIDKLTWDSQKFLTDDASLLVICSTEYNQNDYILDFGDFLKIKNTND